MAYKFSTGSFAILGRGSSDNGTPTVLSSSGKFSASYFYGDGGGITGIASDTVKTTANVSGDQTMYPVFVNESSTTSDNGLDVSANISLNPQGQLSASAALSSSAIIAQSFVLLTASYVGAVAKARANDKVNVIINEPYGIQVIGTGSGEIGYGLAIINAANGDDAFMAAPDGTVTASVNISTETVYATTELSSSKARVGQIRDPGNTKMIQLNPSKAQTEFKKTVVFEKMVAVSASLQVAGELTASSRVRVAGELALDGSKIYLSSSQIDFGQSNHTWTLPEQKAQALLLMVSSGFDILQINTLAGGDGKAILTVPQKVFFSASNDAYFGASVQIGDASSDTLDVDSTSTFNAAVTIANGIQFTANGDTLLGNATSDEVEISGSTVHYSGIALTGSNLLVSVNTTSASATQLASTDAAVTVVSGSAARWLALVNGHSRYIGAWIKLPASPKNGEIHTVKRSSAMTASNTSGSGPGFQDMNVVFVDAGAKTVDGDSNLFLETPGAAVNLVYDGSQWNIY
jgi:hypothetical protein